MLLRAQRAECVAEDEDEQHQEQQVRPKGCTRLPQHTHSLKASLAAPSYQLFLPAEPPARSCSSEVQMVVTLRKQTERLPPEQ